MSDKNGAPISFYQRFSTETLEKMLREMTLSDADLDMEQLDLILTELKSRDLGHESMAPEDALRVFQDEYSGNESGYLDCAYEKKEKQTSQTEIKPNRQKRKHIRFRVLVIAAAMTALIFGSMIAVQASGYDVFGAIGTWTSEVFSFGDVYGPTNSEASADFTWPDTGETRGTGFSSLQEALDAYGIDFEIAEPKWLPEGFNFEEVQISYDANTPLAYIFATYNNPQGIKICVSFSNYVDAPTAVYEKTDSPVEEYTIGDITYYAFSNTYTEKVAWTTEHFECCVFGRVTRSTIKAVAESIYN